MRKILLTLLGTMLSSALLFADNLVHPGTPGLDRPTLTVLGVRLPISGDDNFNATVTVRYRVSGTNTWFAGLPLFRTHPENAASWSVGPEFAGSIFDLRPNTSYDIELHLNDPDGADQTFTITGQTRPVPGDPVTPRNVTVRDVASLQAAVQNAQAGDVITVANGFYPVQYLGFTNSGTAAQPIVLRGASQDGVVLDGSNCGGCNIVEVYGSFVHLEQMTLQNAQRAIRFQSSYTYGNVVRRVHIKNTIMAIGGRENQFDYYIADNIAEGRLNWPNIYTDDGGVHASDTGISVFGFGHVVAHNRVFGYADALRTEQDGARANDFYGNDVQYTYDNCIELDDSEGNTRFFRNRCTNTYDPISFQPVHVGPVYVFRNIVENAVLEQLKFHALGTVPPQEPNGILVFNNTFTSSSSDLYQGSPATSHHFRILNNLFMGPANLPGRAVGWDGPIDDGVFDYNAYVSDGWFSLLFPGGYKSYPNFAAAQQSGYLEAHGMLLTGQVFANGFTASSDYTQRINPVDVTLANGSRAIDRAYLLPNINDAYQGAGPDIGAIESGCPLATYGPRGNGTDETNEVVGCTQQGSSGAQGGPSPSPSPSPNPGPTPPPSGGIPTSWMNVISQNSGKCLDVRGGPNALSPGTPIQQWDCLGGTNQQWQLIPQNGGYQLVARNSGQTVDISGGPGATYNGAPVIQWPYWGGTNEIFDLRGNNDGTYSFVIRSSGKCLDVDGISKLNGALLHQWDCWGGPNQRWTLVPVQ